MTSHRYPWHVVRRGRPILIEEDGRRFFVDAVGDPVFEWSDDDVDPEALARWEEALAYTRQNRRIGARSWKHRTPTFRPPRD